MDAFAASNRTTYSPNNTATWKKNATAAPKTARETFQRLLWKIDSLTTRKHAEKSPEMVLFLVFALAAFAGATCRSKHEPCSEYLPLGCGHQFYADFSSLPNSRRSRFPIQNMIPAASLFLLHVSQPNTNGKFFFKKNRKRKRTIMMVVWGLFFPLFFNLKPETSVISIRYLIMCNGAIAVGVVKTNSLTKRPYFGIKKRRK